MAKAKAKSQAKTDPRHRRFAEAWLTNGFNGYRACLSAGYTGKKESLYVKASHLLRTDKVQAIIRERLDKESMAAAEVIARVTAFAGAPNILDFYDEREVEVTYVNKRGTERTTTEVKFVPDLEAIKEAGLGHMVKGFTREGGIIWHDPMRALEMLSKIHGLVKGDNDKNPVEVVVFTTEELSKAKKLILSDAAE